MAKAKKYSREAILASKEFADVQKDFLAVILCKPEYTLTEARKAVSDFFKEEE
jgi:hypothetical protein